MIVQPPLHPPPAAIKSLGDRHGSPFVQVKDGQRSACIQWSYRDGSSFTLCVKLPAVA